MAEEPSELAALTADIVSAYVSNNTMPASDLPSLIASVHTALGSAGEPSRPVEADHKADKAAIRKSLTPDHLISFIDGKLYKSLKRHLTTNGTTPDEYRAKFGLPKDYPMVAPANSAQRSALAKTLGLGRRAAAEPAAPPVEAAPEAAPAKQGRGKAKAKTPDEANHLTIW